MDIRQALLSLMGRGNAEPAPRRGQINQTDTSGEWGRHAPSFAVGPGALTSPSIGPGPLLAERVGVERPYRPAYPVGPGAMLDGYAQPADTAAWRQPATEQIPGSSVTPLPVGSEAPRRGLEPPNAQRQPQAEMEAQALREALQRAHQATQTEGVPYFRSPSVVNAGDALAAGVDSDRAARDEQSRREGVSWEDWWRLHGRQDGHAVAPFDFENAYRTGRAPPRFSAQSRRPGPR